MVYLAYFKKTVGKKDITFDEILTFMRIQSGLSTAEMRSVFQQFVEYIAIFIPQGYVIQTLRSYFFISIKLPKLAERVFVDSQPLTTNKVRIRLSEEKTLLNRIKDDTCLNGIDTPSDLFPTIVHASSINVYSRLGGKVIDTKSPFLPAGNFQLDVRTCPGKVLRTGMLNEPFTFLK